MSHITLIKTLIKNILLHTPLKQASIGEHNILIIVLYYIVHKSPAKRIIPNIKQ
jgi:hypothetical protein